MVMVVGALRRLEAERFRKANFLREFYAVLSAEPRFHAMMKTRFFCAASSAPHSGKNGIRA
jgi:hypothetical protein